MIPLSQGSPALACGLLGTGPYSRRCIPVEASPEFTADPHHSHYHLSPTSCQITSSITNRMRLSHPKPSPSPTQSMEKSSTTKLVPGAKKVGDHYSKRTVKTEVCGEGLKGSLGPTICKVSFIMNLKDPSRYCFLLKIIRRKKPNFQRTR